MNSTDVFEELGEIGRMINDASILAEIRKAALAVRDDAMVMNASHHPRGRSFDIVVSSSPEDTESIGRRICRDIPQAKVVKIASNLIGIRTSRRGM